MLNILSSFVIILFPALSKFTGLLIYNLGYSFSTTIENLMKEALYVLFNLLVILTLSIFKKSNIKVLNGLLIYLGLVIFLVIISIMRGVTPTTAIIGMRNIVIFTTCIITGYFFVKRRILLNFVKITLLISIAVLLLEIIISPEIFWRKTNYFDYYLFRQEIAIERSGGTFAGYHDQHSVENLFRVFDKSNKTGIYQTRYGSVFADPILFGHFFSAIILILFSSSKFFVNRLFLSSIILASIFFSHSKGCVVAILIYFMTMIFLKWKSLRFLLIVLSIIGLSFFLKEAFQEQTSAVGHITNFLYAFKSLQTNPLFGMGIGSSGHATDDSFIARIISDGGIVLLFGYSYFVFSLVVLFFKYKSHSNIGITLAAFIPPLFSTGAINFLSIYIFCLYIGSQLRIIKNIGLQSAVENTKHSISFSKSLSYDT